MHRRRPALIYPPLLPLVPKYFTVDMKLYHTDDLLLSLLYGLSHTYLMAVGTGAGWIGLQVSLLRSLMEAAQLQQGFYR